MQWHSVTGGINQGPNVVLAAGINQYTKQRRVLSEISTRAAISAYPVVATKGGEIMISTGLTIVYNAIITITEIAVEAGLTIQGT